MTKHYALSLKQPWAALLVYGRKTVEVRRWATTRRGPVLIHAARVPDPRPEAWAQVPPELREAARLVGGVVGAADLTGLVAYRTPQLFVADQGRHLNDPSWFLPPLPVRLRLRQPAAAAVPGVPGQRPFLHHRRLAGEDGMTRLLVSVRSAAEAEAALAGGAAVIDVKEPTRGALGRADDARDRRRGAQPSPAGRRSAPPSASCATGRRRTCLACLPSLAYVKCGLAGCAGDAGRLVAVGDRRAGRCRAGSGAVVSDGGRGLRRLAAGAGAAAGRGVYVRLPAAGLGTAARHLGQGRPDAARLDEPGRNATGCAASAATPA